MLNGMGQLDPAATYPRMIAAAHFERGIPGQLLAGLGDLGLARKHYARHHQRLRAGAAFDKIALDQQVIYTFLFGGFVCIGHGPESR